MITSPQYIILLQRGGLYGDRRWLCRGDRYAMAASYYVMGGGCGGSGEKAPAASWCRPVWVCYSGGTDHRSQELREPLVRGRRFLRFPHLRNALLEAFNVERRRAGRGCVERVNLTSGQDWHARASNGARPPRRGSGQFFVHLGLLEVKSSSLYLCSR